MLPLSVDLSVAKLTAIHLAETLLLVNLLIRVCLKDLGVTCMRLRFRRAAVSKLPAEQFEIYLLGRFRKGESIADLAKITSMAEEAIRQRLFTAAISLHAHNKLRRSVL